MKSSILGLIGATALLFGCSDALEPGSKIDSFRVIAQSVDLPYAHPGETIQLQALEFDPAGRTVNWAWASCVNPSDPSVQGCLDRIAEDSSLEDAVFASGEGVDAPQLEIPTDVLEQLPEGARGFASVGVLSAACPGELTFEGGPAGLPFRCHDAEAGRDLELSEFIIGIKRITVRESERNENPVLSGITFDGEDWPEDEVKEVGWCDRDDFEYDSCADDEKHELGAAVTPESFESGTDELDEPFTEQVVLQFYATEGIFEDQVKRAEAPNNGWVARKSASGQTLRMWFVARDDRGGVTWAERQLRVR
jgi:hypothetical protein